MEQWTSLIASLGFPIVACLALGIFVWKLYERSVKREDKLLEEIAENRKVNAEAINTLALYAERLTVIETDVREIKGIISHENEATK